MTTAELIARLREVDPEGTSQVRMYFRRYGGTTKEVTEVRRFITPSGAVMITDGPRDDET